MLVAFSRRRRTVLLTFGGLAIGGYVSYRLYRSTAMARRRYQVYLLFKSFASIVEVVSEGSDSVSVLMRDLHSFLVSDKDEVPQSLKQLFKLAGCQEVQKCVSAISASVGQGVLHSLSAPATGTLLLPTSIYHQQHRGDASPSKEEHGVSWVTKDKVLSWKDKEEEDPEEIDGVSWREYDQGSPSHADEGTWDQLSWKSAGSLLDGVRGGAQAAAAATSMAKGMKEELVGPSVTTKAERKAEGNSKLADRLLNKLFSEAGKGFASAVVASASRSLVISVIEQFNFQRNSNSIQSSGGEDEEAGADVVSLLLDLASNSKARELIIDCIQTFVATAVSVYLDRTKDVNVFDDMVRGVVKPERCAPVTELLSTVCSSTVETLVHTLHEELAFGGKSNQPLNENCANVLSQKFPSSLTTRQSKQEEKILQRDVGVLPAHMDEDTASSSSTSGRGLEKSTFSHPECPDLNQDLEALVVVSNASINGNNRNRDEAAFTGAIDALSRVLAVPSNRELIMEVAGTMTSEGVRSFIEVVMGRFTTAFRGKTKEEALIKQEGTGMVKRSIIGDKLQQVGDLTKTAVDKSVVAITMCFVICLQAVVGGVRLLQPFSS